ncbi:hypothetical protein ACLOJK_007772 [Asimina triloba]
MNPIGSNAMNMEPDDHLIHWTDFLQEALTLIFSKLDFESLAATAQACRSWRAAAHCPECWEPIHLALHRTFLDQFIKDQAPPPDADKLNSMSLYVLAHGGAGTKALCFDSIATDEMLLRIAARFPSIESISLRNCKGISTAAFSKLISSCKNLKFIDISFCGSGNTTPKTIEEMGRCCPSLVGLNLAHLELTEEMAAAIAKCLPNLKWLNLNSSWITNNDLFCILESCNELQYLNAMWCPRLCPEQELMDMAARMKEFKFDFVVDEGFECDVSYFEKWLEKWYP